MFRSLGVALLLPVLLAAGPTSLPADAAQRIAGTWVGSDTNYWDTLTLAPDGTFKRDEQGKVDRISSGTWNLDGDYLVQDIKESTQDALAGQEMRTLVVDLTAVKLVLCPTPAAPKVLVTYKRSGK